MIDHARSKRIARGTVNWALPYRRKEHSQVSVHVWFLGGQNLLAELLDWISHDLPSQVASSKLNLFIAGCKDQGPSKQLESMEIP